MTARIIDRSDYDVFFRERTTGERRRPARETFLASNSPYKRADVLVESRGCRIRGKDYDMITVIVKDKRRSHEGITQTAMLIGLYGSSVFGTIQCGDEYLVLGGNPCSIYTGLQDCALPAPEAHIAKEDLTGKKHRVKRLFFSRRLKLLGAAASLVCSCAIMTSMMQATMRVSAEKAQPVLTENGDPSENQPKTYCFWEIFSAATHSVRAAGGRIDSYRFDRKASPQTSIAQAGADAEKLAELLENDARITSFRIGDISFIDGTPRFSFSAESSVRTDAGNNGSIYPGIALFRKFAAAQNCGVESIKAQTAPLYSLRLTSAAIPRFITGLREFCAANGMMPSVFDIAIDRASGESAIRLELVPASADAAPIPESPTLREIAALFMVARAQPAEDAKPEKIPARGSRVGIIGINGRAMTFEKMDDGKMSVRVSGASQ